MGTREVNQPWHAVSIDLIGELPRSKNGFRYLSVFECLFSRYITCVPIKRKTGVAVRSALENIVCAQYGAPNAVVTDNGGEFCCEEVDSFARENGIWHERTPTHHARSNAVERVNKDVKTMIRAFIQENHREWDAHIPQFQAAFNSSTHSVTGYPPAFLMFGRQLNPPKLWKRIAEKGDENEAGLGNNLEPRESRSNNENHVKINQNTNKTELKIQESNSEFPRQREKKKNRVKYCPKTRIIF